MPPKGQAVYDVAKGVAIVPEPIRWPRTLHCVVLIAVKIKQPPISPPVVVPFEETATCVVPFAGNESSPPAVVDEIWIPPIKNSEAIVFVITLNALLVIAT